MHQQLEETYENIKDKEKAYANASELYDIVRGQNELRISFERYLQIDYLEQILVAANGRLFDMSNGQYVLKHSEDRKNTRLNCSHVAISYAVFCLKYRKE